MTEPFQPFLQRCISVDLEVDPATATIFAFAAVHDDARPPILAKKRDLMAALHHLVKHYHDGRLQAGHVNDPEMDARLVFQVLRNQLTALTQQNADQPDSVAAFHFLTTTMENSGGFDAAFEEVRG